MSKVTKKKGQPPTAKKKPSKPGSPKSSGIKKAVAKAEPKAKSAAKKPDARKSSDSNKKVATSKPVRPTAAPTTPAASKSGANKKVGAKASSSQAAAAVKETEKVKEQPKIAAAAKPARKLEPEKKTEVEKETLEEDEEAEEAEETDGAEDAEEEEEEEEEEIKKPASLPARFSPSELHEVREKLVSMLGDRHDEIKQEVTAAGDRDLAHIQDSLDVASDSAEGDLALRLAESVSAEAGDIERAIEKIDEGTYGYCDVSSEPIPLERLKFLPWATRLVKFQERFELRRKRQRDGEFEDLDGTDEGGEDE